jgi:hypothetical protein
LLSAVHFSTSAITFDPELLNNAFCSQDKIQIPIIIDFGKQIETYDILPTTQLYKTNTLSNT